MTALRPAEKADCARLAALCAATIPQPWSAAAFEAELARGGCLPAAWEGERLIGFAAVRAEGDVGYLSLIAVEPACRRQGVAGALLTAAEDWCRTQGLSRVLLEVRASNAAAQALYRAHHYETIARRRDFYASPREDGLTMQKELV